MKDKVLAVRADGSMSYCVAPPDMRGRGRCPHIDHQREGESVSEFINRVNSDMNNDLDKDVKDQQQYIENIFKEYHKRFGDNPDWENVIIEKIDNPFVIGKKSDGSYEEAEIKTVWQDSCLNSNGDPVMKLTMNIEFRGQEYSVDMGEIPQLQDDGTIIINGSKFRCLPVMSQFKSGVIQYRDKTVIKQKNGHLAMILSPGSDIVKIGGADVNIEDVQSYFLGKENNLTDKQKYYIDNIDPIAYERFPHLKDDIKAFRDSHTPDLPNDISYRKVYSYEDQVRFELARQMRRMGVTFRTNLQKKKVAQLSGDPDKIERAESLPLFFQKNNTENIKSALLSRSNVQLADNLNPLAALSQMNKVSLTGLGGYNKDKAPVNLRFVSQSHKDIVDSLDVSSGKNVGLTLTLKNSDIDSRGFIVKTNSSLCVGDFIPYKKHNDINRASMAVAHMKQACPIVGGEDPRYIEDASSEAWNKIKGAKIGCNLKVAYLPHEGCHEDAVVISETAARKMATKQDVDYNYNGRRPRKNEAIIGKSVKYGDEINGIKVKYSGVIVNSNEFGFKVRSTFLMGAGDKIAGRHGNKGVVSMVLPDEKMPKIMQDNGIYEPAEILISPMSVTGRMNLGQIYETNNGELNKKTKVKLNNGNIVNNTAGEQFIMRLNHIAEKKLQSYAVERDSKKVMKGMRLGEMESLLLSKTEDRLEILRYLRNQESSDAKNKLVSLLKSVGIEIEQK